MHFLTDIKLKLNINYIKIINDIFINKKKCQNDFFLKKEEYKTSKCFLLYF